MRPLRLRALPKLLALPLRAFGMSKRAQPRPPSIRRYLTLRGGPEDGHTFIHVFVPDANDASGVFQVLPFFYVGPRADGWPTSVVGHVSAHKSLPIPGVEIETSESRSLVRAAQEAMLGAFDLADTVTAAQLHAAAAGFSQKTENRGRAELTREGVLVRSKGGMQGEVRTRSTEPLPWP